MKMRKGDLQRILVMVGTDHAHGRNILEGIGDYTAHRQRWQHRLEVEVRPEPIERAIRHGGIDGMIVESRYGPTNDLLRRVKVPVITVAQFSIENGPPAVLVDNRAVGRMAADHLADLGLKDLAFVPVGPYPSSRDRLEGFAARCRDRHLNCIVMSESAAARGEASLAAWLTKLPEPVGILAATDRLALAVSGACRTIGRAIPESVALLGVDNETETCRLADPPLSSIDHGTRRIGYEAARLLDQWLATGRRPASPAVLIQPIGVVKRPSTDLLAVEDPEVVSALRYIRSNADRPLKVKDVLAHAATSRRTLEMHFRRALGRTIHAEITRVRIDRAKHLLITSDWTMPHIADACGFSFPSQFSYVFKRETGQAPMHFRLQFRNRK